MRCALQPCHCAIVYVGRGQCSHIRYQVEIIRAHLKQQQPAGGRAGQKRKPASKEESREMNDLPAPRLRFKDLEGVWFNEYSVDQCELFDLRRLSMDLCGVCCNEYDEATERKKACEYGHDAVACLCHLILLHYGQDER